MVTTITERRYYYDFICRECKFHNKGYDLCSFKGGYATNKFGMDCLECGAITETNLILKYHKIYGR